MPQGRIWISRATTSYGCSSATRMLRKIDKRRVYVLYGASLHVLPRGETVTF